MRRGNVARSFGIFVSAVSVLLAGCAVGSSQAACAARAPSLEVTPQRAAPGQPLTLRGEGFIGRFVCDDTGPDALEGDATQAFPARDIGLEFRQDGRAWNLDKVDAGRRLGFEARVEVPADARPGPATLVASGDEPAKTALRVIGEQDEVAVGSESPSATLSYGERTVRGELGSHCSADRCMDTAGFPVPAKRDELVVPSGSGGWLDLGIYNPPPSRSGPRLSTGRTRSCCPPPTVPRPSFPGGTGSGPRPKL